MREPLDLRFERERLRHQARHLDQRVDQLLLVRLRQLAARAPGRDREAGEHRKLAVKALVEATPISGPASVGITTSLSRAIVEVGTFTTDSTCCLKSLA